MSTTDRRQKAFAEREQILLDGAHYLISREGLLNLQMHRVAQHCDYSVGTLYQHFSSKEDMLLALLTERIGDRLGLFARVADWDAGSREQLVGLVVADVIFARQQPLFFHLQQYLSTQVISATISEARREQAMAAHKPLADLFQGVIVEALARGDLPASGMTPIQIGSGLWALGEGIHTLAHAEGLMDAYQLGRPYALLFHHFHALLNGLGWQPLCDITDGRAVRALLTRVVTELFSDIPPSVTDTLFTDFDQDSP